MRLHRKGELKMQKEKELQITESTTEKAGFTLKM